MRLFDTFLLLTLHCTNILTNLLFHNITTPPLLLVDTKPKPVWISCGMLIIVEFE